MKASEALDILKQITLYCNTTWSSKDASMAIATLRQALAERDALKARIEGSPKVWLQQEAGWNWPHSPGFYYAVSVENKSVTSKNLDNEAG